MSAPLTVRTLRVVETDDRDAWERFVENEPSATFCHLAGWHAIMTDVLGHEVLARAAVDEAGAWRGVLPLVRMRSRLFGHHLISMPFLNYGGPAGDRHAAWVLADAAIDEARRSEADRLELRGRVAGPSRGRLAASRTKVTVVLDLPRASKTLWTKGFPSKLRSQIRRPGKEGMEARFGPEHAGAFYEVFSRNMRDLGTPVLPRALFERIQEVFPANVLFGAVYSGETPVAAGCGFLWRGEFEMTWASALREFSRSAPNMLLYWSFMEEVIRRGGRAFNFGRCTPGSGTHRFKLQWGGREELLGWAAWPTTDAPEAPSPDQGFFRLASALWSRLPVPLTKRLGPPLARRIPTF